MNAVALALLLVMHGGSLREERTISYTQILEIATIRGNLGFPWQDNQYLFAWEHRPEYMGERGGLWIVDDMLVVGNRDMARMAGPKCVIFGISRVGYDDAGVYRYEHGTLELHYNRLVISEYPDTFRWREWRHPQAVMRRKVFK